MSWIGLGFYAASFVAGLVFCVNLLLGGSGGTSVAEEAKAAMLKSSILTIIFWVIGFMLRS